MSDSSVPATTVDRTPDSKGGPKADRKSRLRIDDFGGRFGILILWGLTIVVFWLLRPETFGTWANFQSIFGSQAILLILALGLLLTLSVGELDLSITGVMTVSVVLVGYLNVKHGWPLAPTLVVALGFGLLAGAINAFFVVVVGVESIVVTLGMGTLLVGVAQAINIETEVGVAPDLVNAVSTQVLGLPLAFWFAVLLTVLVWYLMTLTPLGRHMHFVRMGPDVARLSGVRVPMIRAAALIATAFISALAGVVDAGILSASDPNGSAAYLLPAFSAAFLGSTTIEPGRFNAWGTFVAVYFLVTGITGLQLLGLSGWIESVFYGASLVLAVALARVVSRYELLRRVRNAAPGGDAKASP
jgi:ribose transport system permease protein